MYQKKYVKLLNNDRLQKDIELLKKYFATKDEEVAMKSAMTLFLYYNVDGYCLFTGDVTKEEVTE